MLICLEYHCLVGLMCFLLVSGTADPCILAPSPACGPNFSHHNLGAPNHSTPRLKNRHSIGGVSITKLKNNGTLLNEIVSSFNTFLVCCWFSFTCACVPNMRHTPCKQPFFNLITRQYWRTFLKETWEVCWILWTSHGAPAPTIHLPATGMF